LVKLSVAVREPLADPEDETVPETFIVAVPFESVMLALPEKAPFDWIVNGPFAFRFPYDVPPSLHSPFRSKAKVVRLVPDESTVNLTYVPSVYVPA
jgi:hypothetical protein